MEFLPKGGVGVRKPDYRDKTHDMSTKKQSSEISQCVHHSGNKQINKRMKVDEV